MHFTFLEADQGPTRNATKEDRISRHAALKSTSRQLLQIIVAAMVVETKATSGVAP